MWTPQPVYISYGEHFMNPPAKLVLLNMPVSREEWDQKCSAARTTMSPPIVSVKQYSPLIVNKTTIHSTAVLSTNAGICVLNDINLFPTGIHEVDVPLVDGLRAKGVGQVDISFTNGKNEVTSCKLTNVAFCPSATANIISYHQLMKEGGFDMESNAASDLVLNKDAQEVVTSKTRAGVVTIDWHILRET